VRCRGLRRRGVNHEVGVPVRAERDRGGFAGGVLDSVNRGHLLAEASACGSPVGPDGARVRE